MGRRSYTEKARTLSGEVRLPLQILCERPEIRVLREQLRATRAFAQFHISMEL